MSVLYGPYSPGARVALPGQASNRKPPGRAPYPLALQMTDLGYHGHTKRNNMNSPILGNVSETPTPTTCLKSTAVHPPICTAVRPPFVSPYFPGFWASKNGKPCNTPPICTAVRLPFVRQYAPHLYGSTFEKILGVGVTGTFLIFFASWLCTSSFSPAAEGFKIYTPNPPPLKKAYGQKLRRRGVGLYYFALESNARKFIVQKQQKESIMWCGGPLFSQVQHVTDWFSVPENLGETLSTLDYIKWLTKCTTASQPQSLAIFWIADEIARNFHSVTVRSKFGHSFIAERIATATVSLPQKNRLLEYGQACGHHLQLFNVGGLTMKQFKLFKKIAPYNFDRINESQTSPANHRQETVHLGDGFLNMFQKTAHLQPGFRAGLGCLGPGFPVFYIFII